MAAASPAGVTCWRHLLASPAGVTCWRRRRGWQRRGVWKTLHAVLLERLAAAEHIDWSRAVGDSRRVPAKKGAARPGRLRRIRAPRARSSGLEAAWYFGRPKGFRSPAAYRWPDKAHADEAHADKAYDFRTCRDACRRRGIKHRIARRRIEAKDKLGRHRWVIERPFAWLARDRRLTIRYKRLPAMHHAFLHLGCALICLNFLQRF